MLELVVQINLKAPPASLPSPSQDPELDNPGRWYDYGSELEHRQRVEHLQSYRRSERMRRTQTDSGRAA